MCVWSYKARYLQGRFGCVACSRSSSLVAFSGLEIVSADVNSDTDATDTQVCLCVCVCVYARVVEGKKTDANNQCKFYVPPLRAIVAACDAPPGSWCNGTQHMVSRDRN